RYLQNVERIERLNAAGLDHLQISIDNLEPDEVSKKSLKVLDKKLQMLAEHAEFHVNINSVVGGGFKNPNDALVIGRRALELGFESTIGIIHDGSGQLKPLGPEDARVYFEMSNRKKTNYAQFDKFQEAIVQGRANDWRCRAGSRYLYICEDGLVHYCSQQRGFPGVPLAEYTKADLKREFKTGKSCAPNCTIGCVHRISYIDHWRAPQKRIIFPNYGKEKEPELVKIQTGD
ncbi:MAG: radical SAM protein, partial [Acidobacteriota bacterium]|nr:radical SAM protein [Acidobacteriota bacterium]